MTDTSFPCPHAADDKWIDWPEPQDPPCKHETFSGICMICGAGPDDPCEFGE